MAAYAICFLLGILVVIVVMGRRRSPPAQIIVVPHYVEQPPQRPAWGLSPLIMGAFLSAMLIGALFAIWPHQATPGRGLYPATVRPAISTPQPLVGVASPTSLAPAVMNVQQTP
jgi:hypothetical protein